jgi:DNA-binding transcriptional LysR family regulator
MDLELRHLRTICAIADTGSISGAAVVLGVSQPAITLLLRRMEQSIGGTLFHRDRTGSRPTALGERAVRQARLMLAELESFAADLTDPLAAGAPPPRIGSAHLTCIGSIVDGLEKALPHSGFTLRVEPSAVVLAQLLGHDHLDLAVIGMLEDQQVALPAHIAQRTIVPRLPIFLGLAATDPRSRQTAIKLGDLRDATWICRPEPMTVRWHPCGKAAAGRVSPRTSGSRCPAAPAGRFSKRAMPSSSSSRARWPPAEWRFARWPAIRSPRA